MVYNEFQHVDLLLEPVTWCTAPFYSEDPHVSIFARLQYRESVSFKIMLQSKESTMQDFRSKLRSEVTKVVQSRACQI